VKKRKPEVQISKEGVNHARQVTNDAGHIFREVLEEDYGIDAHIEVCQNDGPTGMLIGLQIRSGESYVHSEKTNSFTYYLEIDDLKYWHEYSLPVFLVIYRPSEQKAYWVDIKEFMKGHKFEDMLAGMAPKKCIVDKSSIFSENFFDIPILKFGDRTFVEWGYNLFLQSLLKVTSTDAESYDIPLDLRKSLFYLNTNSAIKLLNYLNSKQGELVEVLVRQQSIKDALAEEYVTELIIKVRALIFEKEGTGFILIAFEKEEDQDSVAKELEALIPFNHYIILRGERLFLNSYMMNYVLMVASDGWEHGQINIGDEFFPKLQQRFGLQWSRSYEFDFYGSKAASIFCTPNYYFEYTFETVCDTEDSFLLFDYMRTMGSCSQEANSEEYIWMSIGDDRIKIHESWDPALYGYFQCIRTIRSGGEWCPYYDFLLGAEFEITTEKERKDFITKAKAANSLQDLPLMTESMLEGITDGVGEFQ
jgi:hypothetical protein